MDFLNWNDTTPGTTAKRNSGAFASLIFKVQNELRDIFCATDSFAINCPYTQDPSQVMPDVLHIVMAWTEHLMKEADVTKFTSWARNQKELEFVEKGLSNELTLAASINQTELMDG
jgi:hypothetical protein